MLMERKVIRTIDATKDDGSHVTLEQIEFRVPKPPTHADPNDYASTIEIWTSDGQEVARLEKGKYKIKKTGEILQSDNPLAP